MVSWLRKFMRAHIDADDFKSDDDLYIQLIMIIAAVYAIAIHIFYLSYYIVVGIPVMILGNIAGLAVLCAGCVPLLRRKRHAVIGIVITVDVVAYIIFSTYLVGYSMLISLFFLILMAMQVHIPFAPKPLRVGGFLLAWFCMMGVALLEHRIVPVYEIAPSVKMVMTLFNVNAAVLGIVLELVLGNFLRETIRSINDKRLEELQSQAYTDALTGIYNRRYFDSFTDRLRGSPQSEPWCVAALDIDDFKKINDEYGHSAGDKVLVYLTDYIRKCLRKTDVLFRWGGEEFLLFLEDVDLLTATTILEKLRDGISARKISIGSADIGITVTIGAVALDKNDIPGSIERCDQNMYSGKVTGKNRVVSVFDNWQS